MKSAENGAETSLHCCMADISEFNGSYFKDKKVCERGNLDSDVQAALWQVSMDVVVAFERENT